MTQKPISRIDSSCTLSSIPFPTRSSKIIPPANLRRAARAAKLPDSRRRSLPAVGPSRLSPDQVLRRWRQQPHFQVCASEMVATAGSATERGLRYGINLIADAVEAVRRKKSAGTDAGPKFRGVRRRRRRPRSGKFGAQIWDPLRKNNLWLGTFASAEDAAKAYDAAAAQLHGAAAQTNFEVPADVKSATGLRRPRESKRCLLKKAAKKDAAGPYSRTGFWGVRTQSTGKYGAEIRLNKGKSYRWLGTFDNTGDAARAYDAAAVKLHGESAKTNFKVPPDVQPTESLTVATANSAQGQSLSTGNCEIVDELGAVERRRKKKAVKEAAGRMFNRTNRTGFWGVRTQSTGKYGAEISSKGQGFRWLGTFDTAEDAARAYDAAAVKLHGPSAKTNFKILAALQSSESVTVEGAQGQGPSAGNCEIVDVLGDVVGVVERRKKQKKVVKKEVAPSTFQTCHSVVAQVTSMLLPPPC